MQQLAARLYSCDVNLQNTWTDSTCLTPIHIQVSVQALIIIAHMLIILVVLPVLHHTIKALIHYRLVLHFTLCLASGHKNWKISKDSFVLVHVHNWKAPKIHFGSAFDRQIWRTGCSKNTHSFYVFFSVLHVLFGRMDKNRIGPPPGPHGMLDRLLFSCESRTCHMRAILIYLLYTMQHSKDFQGCSAK